MQLPKIISDDQTMQLMQTKWASIINPLLAQPLSSANMLVGVVLVSGDNVINHLLARKMQGWIVSDVNAAATLYRSAPLNAQTLTLNASAPCTVDLMVF